MPGTERGPSQALMDGAALRGDIWLPVCLWALELQARCSGRSWPINFLLNHAGHLVIKHLRTTPGQLGAGPSLRAMEVQVLGARGKRRGTERNQAGISRDQGCSRDQKV